MYSIIRIIIGCGVLGSLLLVSKRANIMNTCMGHVIITGISLICFMVLAFLPFENLMITFDTPNKAYEYYNLGESNIELIVEGNSCDFVVDCASETDTHLIIPKTTDGWKIGLGSNTKKIVQTYSNDVIACVYQYKTTNDYFLSLHYADGREVTVMDDSNTIFYSLKKHKESLNKNYFTYYAHIPNYNPQYCIVVNGVKIALQD